MKTITVCDAGINIWSGASGLGGALTNMSERAKEKGKIKHSYPVWILDREFEDAEAAYQQLKWRGDDAYNDGLMIDILAAKLRQHKKLLDLITARGGEEWLSKCSHWVNAKSARGASWEGDGRNSRFIRNLIEGYLKAVTGKGKEIRVVHVREAPFDVYIGRELNEFPRSIWSNPYRIGEDGSRLEVLQKYKARLEDSPGLLARLSELEGKTLGCWCVSHSTPEENCHGHVLAAMAQGIPWEPVRPRQPSLF